MLLRVSSNQQLEADGDLSIQRQLILDYIKKKKDWLLDKKEYFEGSSSGYKNSVRKRDILQEALLDARNREYDILAVYKDDRVGRRMWEIGGYIMALKSEGVDVYTVKDGCISPETDDVMGQMMLALRYGNAQKSSSDTGMRVKDTAQKLVQQGKFMGGTAPYGYELVLSGELSKHGRALHTLKIIPERAEVVEYIYNLSLHKEYGSYKIAKILNKDAYYRKMAPRDVWKSGTITSILTNPVYSGYVAYKRRERVDGKYHRLDSENWIRANEPDEKIKIIDSDKWNQVQDKRKKRSNKYKKGLSKDCAHIIRKNNGVLPLIDVLYCGECGCKMANGSKYNYWTIKKTGEKKSSKTPVYCCQKAREGVPHSKRMQFRAEWLEKIVFVYFSGYVEKLQCNENVFDEILKNKKKQKKNMEIDIKKAQEELFKIQKGIQIMESHIPDAMTDDYVLSIGELAEAIRKHKELLEEQEQILKNKKWELDNIDTIKEEQETLTNKLFTWNQVFEKASSDVKRVLVDKLIDRIEVTEEQIVIRFKINPREFQ